MKKILSCLFSLFAIFSFIVLTTTNVQAAGGKEQFSFQAQNCYDLEYDEENGAWVCKGPDGNYETPSLEQNDTIKAGKIIKLNVYYSPDVSSTTIRTKIRFNPDLVEPYLDTDGSLVFEGVPEVTTAADADPYPRTCKKQFGINMCTTKWSSLGSIPSPDIDTGSLIFFMQNSEGSAGQKIQREGVLVSAFFRVKSDTATGSVINFSYDANDTDMANVSQSNIELSTTSYTVSEGTTVSKTTLNKLSVSHDSTVYPLTPAFVADSNVPNSFSTTVAPQVTSLNVEAVATDPSTAEVDFNGGNTQVALQTGDNSIPITVTSTTTGEVQTYTLKVYRLSDESSLNTLSLSGIDIGTFNADTTSYTKEVPYSTNSTVVSATTKDSKATIREGDLGNWTLSNYGSTTNSKSIVVNPENCKSEYSTVQKNVCVTKTYTIEITRTAPSTVKTLDYLAVNGVEVPNWSSSTLQYELPAVSNETTSVNISALATSPAKILVDETPLGTRNLSVGNNDLKVKVEAEDGTTQEYVVKIRRKSNNSKLSSLSVTSSPAGILTPTFSATYYDHYTYTLPADATSLTVSAIVDDTENAHILSGTGTYNYADLDPKEVKVKVEAEDGTTSTYIVEVARKKSTNADLSSLSIDGYNITPTFSPEANKDGYTLTVSGLVTSVNVSATAADSRATISGNGSHNLDYGENTITVTVTAEDGTTTKSYTIKVTRERQSSKLSDIKADGASISNFDSDVLEYTLSNVSQTKKTIDIEATPEITGSTIQYKKGNQTYSTGENISLDEGNNVIYIVVTASESTPTTYTISVYREKDTNALLKSLKVKHNGTELTLTQVSEGTTATGFLKTQKNYSLVVENDVTSLDVEAVPESETATGVAITGTNNFVTTSTNQIKITVTANSGNIETYTINVTRKPSNTAKLSNILVSSGTLNPTFSETTTSYTVNVERSVEKITITPVVANASTANVTGTSSQLQGESPNTFSLSLGENIFTITVTPEDGISAAKTYTVTVNRKKSTNAYLSDISVDGTTISGFNKEIESYTIGVAETVSSVTLNANTEEEHATKKILKNDIESSNPQQLSSGENIFVIKVTAEDGTTTKSYTVKINKTKTINTSLSTLSVTNGDTTFALNPIFPTATDNSYVVNVAYSVTNVDIVATVPDANAVNITGTGVGNNKALATGKNEYEIIVTSIADASKFTKYKLTINRSKNNNAYLSDLTVKNGETTYSLSPEFPNSATDRYTLDVPNSVKNVNIIASKQDANATVIGDGNKTLDSSNPNVYPIRVTAEDGITTKTYTVTINREKSNIKTLSNIIPNHGILSPTFDSNPDVEYEVVVGNEVTDIELQCTTTDSKASCDSPKRVNNLSVGDNRVTITVTAENGDTELYLVNVKRQQPANNLLSLLSVKDLSDNEYINNFVSTTDVYDNITVESNVDKVNISATQEDLTNATITNEDLGLKNLNVGLNTFGVRVKSGNGITRTYTIRITRKASTNSLLSRLEVENYTLTPPFADNKTAGTYKLTVESNVENVNIIAEAEASTSLVTGAGPKNLISGVNTFPITVTAQDHSTTIYTVEITKKKSSNNLLANITVNGVALEVRPDLDHYELNFNNNVDKAIISATAQENSAIIKGIGTKGLNVGDNTFVISVTAEDGSGPNEYTIKITREASQNNYLSDLKVNGTTIPDFNKEVTNYQTPINVGNDINSVTVTGIPEYENATVTGGGVKNLNTGDNSITITVTAENGDTKNYSIVVNRAKSNNALLSDLYIDEGTFSSDFNSNDEAYSVSVPYEVDAVTVHPTPQEEHATFQISLGANSLIVGLNTVDVTVTAEDGTTTKTYTIKVTRQPEVNNFATNITVKDNNNILYQLFPTFDMKTTQYQVGLSPTATSVNIKVDKADSNATVSGDGDNIPITSLPYTHKVEVTLDNTTRTYNIVFVKGISNNNKLLSLSVNPGSLSPAFNADRNVYEVEVPNGTSVITINATGTEDSSIQPITGTGTHTLTAGERNEFSVVVTSESGIPNVYTIFVSFPGGGSTNPTSDNVLSSLSINPGTLNPTFDPSKNEYTVDFDEEISQIEVTATGENEIEGAGTYQLNSGANPITVKSIDENGKVNSYKIIVNNGSVNSTELADLYITNYPLNEAFSASKTDYTAAIITSDTSLDVHAIARDENAVVTITGKDNIIKGENTITILVTKEGLDSTTYTIDIDVLSDKIESEVHNMDDLYIRTITPETTLNAIKDELSNPNEYIKIYDSSDNEITDYSGIAKTGYKVKLVVSDTEYDSKIIIIKGDLTCDGKVNAADYSYMQKYLLKVIELDPVRFEAGKLNNDKIVNAADYSYMQKYLLKAVDLFQRVGE